MTTAGVRVPRRLPTTSPHDPLAATKNPHGTVLSVDEARLAFGGLQALDGASISVGEGEVVGLIGPNGAGKTTLFNSISGLQRIDRGTIRFREADVTSWPAHRRAALGIGRSFQHLGLMPDETVATNVLAAQHRHAGYGAADVALRPWRWARRERDLAAAVDGALAPFGLAGSADAVVRDLSFAAARFVELASLLVTAPSLLLLDEPTTGLDVAEIAVLAEALRAVQAQGTAILVIAHDVAFVMELCDRVYVLAQGSVLAEGLPADIQDDPVVIEAYLGAPA